MKVVRLKRGYRITLNDTEFAAAHRQSTASPLLGEIERLKEALGEADIAILGAHMLLEGAGTNATSALAKSEWKPHRAHIEGMRNTMNKALSELQEARQALASLIEGGQPNAS